jgi:hypothetical protein
MLARSALYVAPHCRAGHLPREGEIGPQRGLLKSLAFEIENRGCYSLISPLAGEMSVRTEGARDRALPPLTITARV